MDYVGRSKALILTPKEEFRRIAGEVEQPMDLLVRWAVPMSAIPVVCGLVGLLVFGGLFGPFRPGFFRLLLWSLASYALGLVGVVIIAKLFEILAPRFGGTADPDAAMKIAVYAPTAAWLAGIFSLIPPLGFLGILGLYSLYLLWVAIPILVRVPEERRLLFTVTLVLAALGVNLVIGLVVGVLLA
jgi:hypothetical protein